MKRRLPGRHRAALNLPCPLSGTAAVAASGLLVAATIGAAAPAAPASPITTVDAVSNDQLSVSQGAQVVNLTADSWSSLVETLKVASDDLESDLPVKAVPAPPAEDGQHTHFGDLGFTGVTPEPEPETPVETATDDTWGASGETLDGAGVSAGSSRVEGQSASRSEARPEAPAEPVAPEAPAAAGQGGEGAIAWAQANLGLPYSWGSKSGGAYDCSGFTTAAFRAAGINIPHGSEAQYHATNRVSLSQIQRGDLLFYSDNGSASGIFHVAIYLGDGQVIHSLRDWSSWDGSKINGINYASGLMGAGRP
ncbi:C40 family peptidase [Ornithinimicrobium murale]|uniref:C40 family peptidase n=1 Tax=Ornithinimicrobium murale TaxID=1050153 RepID=UPI001EE0D066|nr:C40 family peptidase [Ornithinimicrobium murale]